MGVAPDAVRALLHRQQIATLADLKTALGTSATMTVFRTLKALGYRTSYSHRGKYYTLAAIPRFDAQGLWSHRGVWFSRDGTLLATAQRFVEEAGAGVTAGELQALLRVEAKEPLLQLVRRGQIAREPVGGRYVYFAGEPGRRREQRLRRREVPAGTGLDAGLAPAAPELQAAIALFVSLLDEQQRRLYAGLEAHRLGHGGDREIAACLGLDPHTVARGRRELFGAQVQRQRVRRPGGGRVAAEKKRRRSSTA